MKSDYIYFEEFIQKVLEASGQYVNVSRHTTSQNRQLDIFAIKKDGSFEFFEIKLFSSNIPIGLVDQVYGKWIDVSRERGNFKPYIISLTPYTKSALQKANQLGIALWGLEELKDFLNNQTNWNALFSEYKPRIKAFSRLGHLGKLNVETSQKTKEQIFIENIIEIKPGKKEWSLYQQTVYDILEHLLCPPLDAPKYELADTDKRNRRDIIFENTGGNGFWKSIKEDYQGHYIVVDAKNYSKALPKRPIIDIAHYLKPYGCGMFALIVTRKGLGPSGQHARKEQWIGVGKMIVVLSDNELIRMLEMKMEGENPEEVIRQIISNFRMKL